MIRNLIKCCTSLNRFHTINRWYHIDCQKIIAQPWPLRFTIDTWHSTCMPKKFTYDNFQSVSYRHMTKYKTHSGWGCDRNILEIRYQRANIASTIFTLVTKRFTYGNYHSRMGITSHKYEIASALEDKPIYQTTRLGALSFRLWNSRSEVLF